MGATRVCQGCVIVTGQPGGPQRPAPRGWPHPAARCAGADVLPPTAAAAGYTGRIRGKWQDQKGGRGVEKAGRGMAVSEQL